MQASQVRWWLVASFALVFTAGAGFSRSREDRAAAAMAKAATSFLAGLDEAQRARASFAFESPVRQDWHFIPRERKGLTLGEMEKDDCDRLDSLLASGLSQAGRARFAGVIRLEWLLRDLESRPGAPATHRDPANYSVAIFGQPGVGPWGWRVEGHHYSAHFSSIDDGELTVTPSFVGSNPARVSEGEYAGFELLGPEDHAARALVVSLPEKLRSRASLGGATPADVLWLPGVDKRDGEPRGIAAAEMDEAQRAALKAIVELGFADLSEDLAARERARFEKLSPQALHFAFAGDPAEGQAWYWRVQSGDFAIEFCNPAGAAGHAHRLWRDLRRDFGGDPLREHLAREHK